MAESQIHGKSAAAVAHGVAEGLIFINPLTLKKYDGEVFRSLYHHLRKIQRDARGESFPQHDAVRIRNRNMRLQRLNSAITIIEHAAKERRILLV